MQHVNDSLFSLEMKFVLKIEVMSGEFNGFFIIKKHREALTVLCSVVEYLGRG